MIRFVPAFFVALLALPAAAETPEPRVTLPPDVAQRVAELRTYGDRFEKTIRLIEAEAAKPGWGWEDGCSHDSAGHALPAM